jgi:L-ascorbate metabolism protein UlaG (beta-lactamase superfamily)
MKIIRFVQSCLLIEEGNTKVLVDPGTDFKNEHDISELPNLDAVLYTHEHADHFDVGSCEQFIEGGVKIYANESTAKLISKEIKVVEQWEEFEIGDFNIRTFDVPHCLMPTGTEGPQNTGYLFNEKFFDPGDGVELKGLKVDNIALPITGPDISMKDAFEFAVKLHAKIAIPVHYDKLGANAEVYKQFAQRLQMPFSMKVLDKEQSIEL